MSLFLSWIALSLAVQVDTTILPCPVGSGNVKVYQRLAYNTAGGWDSDLASYSSGGQWRSFQIASCMDGLFSVYNEDMRRVYTAAERVKLDVALRNVLTTLATPNAPEVWERYAIAAAMYQELGKDPAFIAEIWLHASWTARDAAVGFYADLQGPLAARGLLDAGVRELEKPLSVEDRKKVLFNLARIAERAGLPRERDQHVAAFETAGTLTAEERTVITRFKQLTREIIPPLQDKVIAAHQAALAGPLSDDTRIQLTYVLADTLRRRGRIAEARPLYAAVVNSPAAPAPLDQLAAALRDWT